MEARTDSINVLHVDDEPEFAEMVATFVERADDRFEFDTVPSANEGLDRLAEDEYQCVVSDYDMPGQNGIEFLEAVSETYPDLPFILYTGKGSEEVASDAISAGATDYLQKESGTGQYEVLANRINNAVSQARSQQAERHLRELAENTNQILYIFNHDWSELVFINAAYEDMWGRPVEALRNDPTDFLNGIHPDDREHVREAMNRMSGGETVQIEYRVNPSEDYERWVSVRGEPIVDETGTVVRVAGLAIDITDRKRQEQELERIRDFFREAERLGDIGAWEFDSTGGVFWSEGTRRIHEVDDDFQPSIETGIEFFHPDDRSAIEQAVQSSLDTGESFDEEGRLITAEDNQRWVKIRGEPLADGETVRGYIQNITEQKERERELELAETVFEYAQDAIFVVDVVDETEFRVERVNPAYERRTGLDAKEIRGKSPRDIVGDEFGATIEARYRECVTEQAPMEYEETIPLAGDTTHWQTTLAPVVEDGTVVRLVGATRDITERKRHRQELERNRDLLRHAERVASVGAVEIDPHTEEVRWTDGTRAIHGVADDYEPSVETALDFYPPDDREAVRRDFERCLETGEPYHGEYRLQTADDEIRWVEIHGEAVQEDGDTVLVRGAVQDITDHKEREQELQQVRDRMEFALNATDAAIWDWNVDTDQTTFYPSEEDLYGRSVESRSDFLDLVHPDDRPTVREALASTLDTGEPKHEEVRILRDDEVRWIEAPGKPICDDDGTTRLIGVVRDITERKRKERELQRYEALIETLPIGYVRTSFDDEFLDMNSTFVNMLDGDSENEIQSHSITEFYRDQTTRDRLLDTLREEGEVNGEEVKATTLSGDTIWVAITGRLIDDDSDTYADALVQDITERKERERELRAHSTAMEASIDGMAILDDDETYTFVNQAHADIYGYDDREAFLGESWRMCYSEDELDWIEEEIMAELYETGSWRGEATGQRQDGTTFPQELSLTTLDDGGVVCVVRDITERKQREQALRETTSQLQGVMETVEAAIFIKDTEGQYQLMNEKCKEILGLGPDDEIIGLTDEDLFPPPVAEQYRADDRRVLEQGETIKREEEVPTEEGTRTHLTFKSPLVDAEGATYGVCAVSTDITERKQREQELEQKNERLDQFASVVSHDLRNPLTVADGSLELAQKECDSEHLDRIDSALDRMDALIEDLLTLAREGETVTDFESVDLATIAEGCWANVETADATRMIDVDRMIYADKSRLKQVIENLVRNAVEHGGKDVAITIGELEDGFYIEDDGPGISEGEGDDVFDAGYSTSEDGTGFGLSIVQQIVDAHGWKINVTGGAAGGARFVITGVEFAE